MPLFEDVYLSFYDFFDFADFGGFVEAVFIGEVDGHRVDFGLDGDEGWLMGLGVRLGRDGLLEAGAFFEGADFFEAGAAGGVAADEGDYGGVGPDLDQGVADDFLDGFGALGMVEFGAAGGEDCRRDESRRYLEDCFQGAGWFHSILP